MSADAYFAIKSEFFLEKILKTRRFCVIITNLGKYFFRKVHKEVLMVYPIIKKEELNPTVSLMEIEAPYIARKAEPGQFLILRIDEEGERVPFTIADYHREKGTVTIIFQIVGATTERLNRLKTGEFLLNVVGPLGKVSEFDGVKKVAVIGGGLGTAIAYPQAKKLHSMGICVDMICGFRNKDLIIIEDLCRAACDNLSVMTDDGSNGNQGFVTTKLEELIQAGNQYDLVVAIGPLAMMRAVCNLTKEYDIKTIVSMNPIMIDGTGMCGGCRLTVGGEIKFACVDGPDFDGHLVDFDEAINRSKMFRVLEQQSKEHHCRLEGMDRA